MILLHLNAEMETPVLSNLTASQTAKSTILSRIDRLPDHVPSSSFSVFFIHSSSPVSPLTAGKMHATGPRLNVFFTHLMTMLFVLISIGSSGSYLQLRSSKPIVHLRATQLSRFRQMKMKQYSCDQAYLTFDLTADFTKAWSWNINHMYIYVVAEYTSKTHTRNEVIVWDSILSSKKQALVKRPHQPNKYSLRDHGYGLRGADVKLKFKYNILPYMGPLFYGEEGETSFTVPSNYNMSVVRLD